MTVSELVSFGLLALFAIFHGLHQWMFIRKQQAQIVQLQRYFIVHESDAPVHQAVANDQNLERLALQNQQPPRGMHHLPVS